MKVRISELFVYCLIMTLVCCDRENSNPPGSSKSEKQHGPAASSEPLQPQPESVKSPSASLDSDRPPMRAPKQKYPASIIQPEQPNSTMDKVNKAIADANGNIAKIKENLTLLWNDGIAGLPNTPLPSSKVTEIANGTILPSEIATAMKEPQTGTGENTTQELIRGVALCSAMICNDLLTKFASDRANSLPPTMADVAIYEALKIGVGEFSQTRGQDSYASFEEWKPFANVANPIYRLLALRAASLAVSKPAWNVDVDSKEFNRINQQPKLEFYLTYLDEQDPVILTEALRTVATIPLPEARQAIENFHTQQVQLGDAVLIQAAEEALKTQKLISP